MTTINTPAADKAPANRQGRRKAKGQSLPKETTGKAKTPANAKAKAPTKAERQRINLEKANAKAKAKLPQLTYDAMRDNLIRGTAAADGAARTFAHWMNNTFASPMKDYKCHWSAFTPANCRTDNEKALLARINGIKTDVRDHAAKRGLSNVNKPWSDMRKIALQLFSGGRPNERQQRALEVVQKELLTKLYRAGMKEERPTEAELELNTIIGRALIQYFKVDLSTLG